MAVTAKVDCRVCVISTLYETKQATLPRKNNQIYFGFGKNQGAGKRPRQCCPKGPRTKGTATRGPEGPESGQNMRVRGPEGPEDEQS